MEPTIRAILCPHCKNILFALELDAQKGGASWNITKDSPAVQKDAAGQYMNCGKCTRRVAVEKVTGPGIDTWKVAATQK